MKKPSLCLIALLLAAPAQTFAGMDEAREVAEANIALWNSAFAKGKVDEIVSLYAPDAMLVRPDGTVSANPAQIRAFWLGLLKDTGGVITVDIQDAKGEAEGIIITRAKLTDIKTLQNTQHVMKYNYEGVLYSVLKRQSDGSWKAQVQQWRSKG
jgi:ketosteroid isomerase-like protein